MNPPRRVVVTSPQTQLALSGRRAGTPSPTPRLTQADAARASLIRRVQLRRAAAALAAAAALLVGVPIVIEVFPGLVGLRFAGVPLPWLAVAVLPYPVMAGLGWWQLRRAAGP